MNKKSKEELTAEMFTPAELAEDDNPPWDEDRVDTIGQNGNTGEHYEEDDPWDSLDFLEGEDLGDIDPSIYQFEEDEGCEGGACKI